MGKLAFAGAMFAILAAASAGRAETASVRADFLGILHTDDTTVGTYEFEVGKEADLPFFDGRRPVVEVIGIIE